MSQPVYFKSLLLFVLMDFYALQTPEQIQGICDALNPTKSDKGCFYSEWRQILNNSTLPLSTLIAVFPDEVAGRFFAAHSR